MASGGMSGNDFAKMQREAEKRVMEMQRRAKNTLASNATPQPEPARPVAGPGPRRGFLDMLNLRSMFEGKDTTLVLMVLALLNAEDTDPLLMLALLYIVM